MTKLFHPGAHCRMLFLLGLLLPCVSVLGQERLQVQVSTGYQREDLNWSIAGNSAGQNPNVYSELKWQAVGGISAGAALSWKVWRKVVVFVEGKRGVTLFGTGSGKGYSRGNRTCPGYGHSFYC